VESAAAATRSEVDATEDAERRNPAEPDGVPKPPAARLDADVAVLSASSDCPGPVASDRPLSG
jgi:hypothetical protein